MSEPALPRFYVASSEPAGAVSACTCGNFIVPTERNLAITRKDQLDLFGFTAEGLKVLATTRLVTAVEQIRTIHPAWAKSDLLFVLFKNLDVLILEFGGDVQGHVSVRTIAAGSVVDKVGRLAEMTYLIAVDPESRCIALHNYESLIRIIPLRDPSHQKEIESFNVRVDQNYITSIQFLHNCHRPTLAMLHSSGKHISSFEVDFKEKELKDPSGKHVELKNLEEDTLSLFAVPGTNKGLLACGVSILTYVDIDGIGITATIRKENRGIGVAYSILSDSTTGTKILVGDYWGSLHVIYLKKDPVEKTSYSKVVECGVISLGRLAIASCLTYLDNRIAFVGSRMAESSVIRLLDEPHPDTGLLFDVLETIPNVGCVVDFSFVRSETQGSQPQIIVCSSMGPGVHARIIRSGIGMQEITSLEAPTGRQIFGVNSRSADVGPHDWLVVSFLNETKVLKMEDAVGEFDDLMDVGAFVMNDATHLVAKIRGLIVQITRKSIRAIEPGSLALKEEWFPSDRTYQIGSAGCYKNQVVAAAFDTLLVVSVNTSGGSAVKEINLDDQISAVHIHSFSNGESADYIVAATWKMDLVLLEAPEWNRVANVDLNSDVFARSVLLQQLDNIDYVIAGLGDGSLQYFVMDKIKGKVGQPKRVTVGTQPTYLKSFVARGMTNIFVCNDRPSVIHSSSGKLIFSNVNMKHVYGICELDSEVYPSSLAIITESGIVVGKMDEIQKLHIRSVSLPGNARRVAYQTETGTYGFIAMDVPTGFNEQNGSGDSEMTEEIEEPSIYQCDLPLHKLLITDQTNYQVLASYVFARSEMATTLISGSLGSDPRTFYIVGTGTTKRDEKECTNGRIIVFQYAERNLSIVAEKSVKGLPTEMQIFKDKLLLTVGSSLKLMSWNEDCELVAEHSISQFILPKFFKIKGDFVLVGDLIRSLTVLVYRNGENKFDVVASDPFARWPTAAEFIDDDVYVLMDDFGNMLFFRRDTDPNSGDLKDLTEIAGANFADIANVMKKGTLLPDTAVAERPFAQNGLIMGTHLGAIMQVLTIDENTYQILKQLSDKLIRSVMPFDRVLPEKYNAIQCHSGTKPAHGVINGDIIELIGAMNNDEVQELITGVVDVAKAAVTVEQVVRLVEDLSRSH